MTMKTESVKTLAGSFVLPYEVFMNKWWLSFYDYDYDNFSRSFLPALSKKKPKGSIFLFKALSNEHSFQKQDED